MLFSICNTRNNLEVFPLLKQKANSFVRLFYSLKSRVIIQVAGDSVGQTSNSTTISAHLWIN